MSVIQADLPPASSPSPANRDRWMDRAACKGRTELFFAPHAERPPARIRRENVARKLCMSCPVRIVCRDQARAHLEHGMWGGESEAERVEAGYIVAAPIGGRIARAG